MINFLTTKRIADIWGVSPRRVAILCEQGRIRGAEKVGGVWLIPPETGKPEDARKAKGKTKEGSYEDI